MSDAEAQEDELLALASIYDETIFSASQDGDVPGGQFCATLELPQPFSVLLRNHKGETQELAVQFLPPINFFFQLPPNYPSNCAPTFTLSCKWLDRKQLSSICRHLDEMWQENHGEVILFLWTSFLKEETLDFLSITSPLDLTKSTAPPRTQNTRQSDTNLDGSMDKDCESNSDKHHDSGLGFEDICSIVNNQDNLDQRAIQDIGDVSLLLPTITEYDKAQKDSVFRTTLFSCHVCFLEKLGALCIKFPGCEHTYCKECMKSYFEVQIEEGQVQALTCPSDKCESQAHPAQVKELVGGELFARYDRLLLQSSLDTMSDIQYCPRSACGCAVMVDTANNMGSCPKCHFVFCVFCKGTYHGVSPCKIKSDEVKRLREQYVAASENDKRAMEKRYGRVVIRRIIEDSFTEEWLEEYSKKCPHCSTHIQKIDGCNKMTCTKCRSYFCWICMALLSRNNPYLHFSNPQSDCFNRLFQGVVPGEEGDEEEEEPPVWII